MPNSILFYSDSVEYGGHDVLTIDALNYLAENCHLTVGFVFYAGNARLAKELQLISNQYGNVRLYPVGFKSGRLPWLRAFVAFRRRRALQRLFTAISPDVIIVAQGRIEAGSMGLLAARKAGIRTISYIPMAHSVSVSGKNVFPALRDGINRRLYSTPDQIITISEAAKSMLQERGATCEITVVRNGIEPRSPGVNRTQARDRLGVKADDYVVGILGRIQFRQKGQDFALAALHKFSGELRDVVFCFVGSGPDERKLRKQLAQRQLMANAMVVPWCDNPENIYPALDMLLIPSRFEGVPLVMLEAMVYELPIVASDLDGMHELLPASWLFPFGNQRALVDTLLRVRQSKNLAILEQNRRHVLTSYTKESFQRSFAAAVLGSNWIAQREAEVIA